LSAGEHPESGWIKSPHNPMLSLSKGDAFDSHNIMGPAVARRQGTYYLLYAGGPAGPLTGEQYVRYQLGLAVSEDGIHWKKAGKPLLELGERDDFHVTPALLRNERGDLLTREGIWTMVYCGNRADDVELATSPDGRNWNKDPRSPIYRRAYAPNLVRVDDETRMYYIHKPTDRPWEVHVATGADVTSLKPYRGNPLLTVSQKWEAGNLVYPYVLREGSTWVMFYAAYWRNPAGPGMWTAIGMATSPDGLKWKKHPNNPILKPTPGSPYDSRYTSSQAVIRDGDHYSMYYAGRIDGIHKYYSIALATKSDTLL
jgi:predicted GH43/DUF377 family glycosyl hydrolase